MIQMKVFDDLAVVVDVDGVSKKMILSNDLPGQEVLIAVADVKRLVSDAATGGRLPATMYLPIGLSDGDGYLKDKFLRY